MISPKSRRRSGLWRRCRAGRPPRQADIGPSRRPICVREPCGAYNPPRLWRRGLRRERRIPAPAGDCSASGASRPLRGARLTRCETPEGSAEPSGWFLRFGAAPKLAWSATPESKNATALPRRFASRDSVGIRTQDPQLRRLLLYPTELRSHAQHGERKDISFLASFQKKRLWVSSVALGISGV